jgi:hypothetical protein
LQAISRVPSEAAGENFVRHLAVRRWREDASTTATGKHDCSDARFEADHEEVGRRNWLRYVVVHLAEAKVERRRELWSGGAWVVEGHDVSTP